MSGPPLTVAPSVIVEMVRLAALEVPGVLRVGHGGPPWRAWLARPAIRIRIRDDAVHVRLRFVARPGVALSAVAAQVRLVVGSTVERLLGLRLGAVTVVVDGVGG